MQNAKCKIILATAQQKHPPQKKLCGGINHPSLRGLVQAVAISIIVFNGTQWHSFAAAHLMAVAHSVR